MQIVTSRGIFEINIQSRDIPPPDDDDDDDDDEFTAIQIGCDFSVSFTPITPCTTGILQLIHPLTDVGAYSANKTKSDWAVDKRPAALVGATTETYKLIYGIKGQESGDHGKIGSPGTAARMEDTPKEIIPLRRVDLIGPPTTFVSYAANLDKNEIYNQGFTWGYFAVKETVQAAAQAPVQAAAAAQQATRYVTKYTEPVSIRLSENFTHLEAIAHFIKRTPADVEKLIGA